MTTKKPLKVETILDYISSFTTTTPSNTTLTPPSLHHPHIKLEVPQFDSHDPLGWMVKILQFINYQGTLEEVQLIIASFYTEVPALSWY